MCCSHVHAGSRLSVPMDTLPTEPSLELPQDSRCSSGTRGWNFAVEIYCRCHALDLRSSLCLLYLSILITLHLPTGRASCQSIVCALKFSFVLARCMGTKKSSFRVTRHAVIDNCANRLPSRSRSRSPVSQATDSARTGCRELPSEDVGSSVACSGIAN